MSYNEGNNDICINNNICQYGCQWEVVYNVPKLSKVHFNFFNLKYKDGPMSFVFLKFPLYFQPNRTPQRFQIKRLVPFGNC